MEVGVSFSTGRVAYKHDIRDTISPNVNKDLINDDLILEDNLHGKSIEEYTNEKFQPYIDEYNLKQTRENRKIKKTYCEYLKSQKQPPKIAYEAVMQYGESTTLGGAYYQATDPAERERLRKELVEVYSTALEKIKEKYPHLDILYATIHFDEDQGTPHMHLCYQPVGDGFKKGLSHQISLSKALTLDGVERVTSRSEAELYHGYQQAKWYYAVRHDIVEPLVKARGYTIKKEIPGRKRVTPSIYKQGMKELEARQEAVETIVAEKKAEVKATQEKLDSLQQDVSDWTAERDFTVHEVAQAEETLSQVQSELEVREAQVSAAKEAMKDYVQNYDPLIRFVAFMKKAPVPKPFKEAVEKSVSTFIQWERDTLEKLEKVKKWTYKSAEKGTIVKEKDLESLEK